MFCSIHVMELWSLTPYPGFLHLPQLYPFSTQATARRLLLLALACVQGIVCHFCHCHNRNADESSENTMLVLYILPVDFSMAVL